MPRLSLRTSLIVHGRIRRLVRNSPGCPFARPAARCPGFQMSSPTGFSDLPGTGYILYTSAYTPAPTTRRPGLLRWSKSAPHEALFTTIHDRPRNSGKPLRISMAGFSNVFP
jgi:hypothetical protein